MLKENLDKYIQTSQNFWENKHKEGNTRWLSDSTSEPNDIFRLHKLAIPKDKIVMDIGIGTGRMAKFLKSADNQVIPVDISYVALERIQKEAGIKGYHVSKLKESPLIDLAISHLTFQHCSDVMILHIINSVNLKKDGSFSFQFAFLANNNITKELKTTIANGIEFFRPLSRMEEMIKKSNKKIEYISKPIICDPFEGNHIGWRFIKVS